MDVSTVPSSSSNNAVPVQTPAATNSDEARRAQERKDADEAQRKLDEQRAEDARAAQARQASRNSNGEVIGTTISTTA